MTLDRTCVVAMALLTLVACEATRPAIDEAKTGTARAAEFGPAPEPYVVIATLDTGTNLIHSSWHRDRNEHPSSYLPGYPDTAWALEIELEGDFQHRLTNSAAGLASLHDHTWPRWVPGTNLIGLWAARDSDLAPVFDGPAIESGSEPFHRHGAQASSQIAATAYGMAEDALLVVMDRSTNLSSDTTANSYEDNRDGVLWAADQRWIDIIHTNIQNFVPLAGARTSNLPYDGFHEAVQYALDQGKLVVSAAGNFYALPTETSPHAGPVGVLIAGANDNCGYADFSNPNPHVVMDGVFTESASATDDGTESFSGTSSASPRIAGYVGKLLLEIRRAVGDRHGFRDGHLIVLEDPALAPKSGPLSDGRLHAGELHEIVRKTANPEPHDSRYDGRASAACIPQPQGGPAAVYPKMGFGEVSEHTLPLALAVALGEQPMPDRPVEDALFEQSNAARMEIWR